MFANVANGQRLETSDGLGSFLVHYGAGSPFNPTQIVLSAFQPGIPGDFDFDGDVDGRDFLVWQRGGSPAPLGSGDLADWKANFGAGGASAAGAPIPEPHSVGLAEAGALIVVAFRRRRVPIGRAA